MPDFANILQTTEESLKELFTTFNTTEKGEGIVPCINRTDYNVYGYHLDITVQPKQLLETVEAIDRLEYFIESITGVDWPKEDEIEAVYDFNRYDENSFRIVVRTRCDRQAPVIPSITSIYSGANWHEREARDFFGIDFTGHPHLIPLLLPEDADFHPLLKDFKG